MRPRPSQLLALAGLVALGCGSRMVKLDAEKVRGLSLVLVEGGQTFCPYAPLWPEVVARIDYAEGKVLETHAPHHPEGTVRHADLEWTTEVGTLADNGVWVMPWDLLPWHDRSFVVRASVPSRPEISAELRVAPRFDCGGEAELGGLDGRTAARGEGEPGGRGPHLEVALAYVETELHGRLILVRTIDRDLGRRGYHLVDPRAAARFRVIADGGDGGAGADGVAGSAGASGARGADGASGASCEDGQPGAPGGDGGHGGDGQPGGRGGDAGDGGTVTVSVPPGFPELAAALDVSVEGGTGGAGGAGGPGGAGEEGGRGGRGGSAGPTSDPGVVCTTAGGQDGRDGARGSDGRTGERGAGGRAGQRGSIATRSESVESLFAFELGRGWRLVGR